MVMVLSESLSTRGADSIACGTFSRELKMTDGETWTGNALFRLTNRAPASGNACLKRTAHYGTGRQ